MTTPGPARTPTDDVLRSGNVVAPHLQIGTLECSLEVVQARSLGTWPQNVA